jgi:hypothetical protein
LQNDLPVLEMHQASKPATVTGQQSLEARPHFKQSAITFQRVAAFCCTCDAYGSLKSPVCSCVSIALSASS